MKKIVITLLAILSIAVVSVSLAADSNEFSQINAIARKIKENGPSPIRCLPMSTIQQSVMSFYYGQKAGSISREEMARMGGVEGAAILSLSAQAKAAGSPCR
ncbi:MAG: hypothetical protein WCP54_07640 [Actinomycetes bacterium]